jgi:hypothetical protein
MRKIEDSKFSQVWDPINFEAGVLVFKRPAYAFGNWKPVG